ncbi:MAG: polyketide cyclase [Rhodobacterales bacterium]|nr:MAG: polyketide cyclase [Rhodobacterales bacterium]
MEGAGPTGIAGVLARHTSPDWHWRGMHPFHEQHGADAVARAFWHPYLTAFTAPQRREDVFFAGRNEIDGFRSVWVVSMGHIVGLFDRPWLGIRPTRMMTYLRYAEFHKVERGKITETAFFFDIPHVMAQAGQNPLPPQTAAHIMTPGPRTHDGLLHAPQDPAESAATLALINRMINDINAAGRLPPEQELARCWHDDMAWYGPTGIGATYTIGRYIEQHQRPFRTHLTDRVFNGHKCRLAEGRYGGFFGWANLTLRNTGGFMGMTGSERPADMRVVDIYRRDGDKLAENWVFIDLLHFLNQQGLDLLERAASLNP